MVTDDLDTNAAWVQNGGAIVTPDYTAYVDPNMLNLTNPACITAAMSYITGGYRPGNENLAPTVNAPQEFTFNYNLLDGVGVNSGISRRYALVDATWSSVKVWVDANHDGKSWNDANSSQRRAECCGSR